MIADLSVVTKIMGPPGTGKTTTLIGIVSQAFSMGMKADDIIYLAFTKKAANEARSRMAEQVHMLDHELTNFRTIHSLAFSRLGLSRSQVISFRDILEFCRLNGLGGEGDNEIDEELGQLGMGVSKALALENLCRVSGKTPEEVCTGFSTDPGEVVLVGQKFRAFKTARKKMDYTDMLHRFAAKPMLAPKSKLLIVDEAQDLSIAQWKVIENLADRGDKVMIAGDDDQAIFKWAGAASDYLIDMPCATHVLPKSYRVPVEIQKVANKIVHRIKKRIPKRWTPREGDEGKVTHLHNIQTLPLDKGQWLLLARNRNMLELYENHCIERGYLFNTVGNTEMSSCAGTAIKAWLRLCAGERITADDAREIYKYMSSGLRVRMGAKSMLENAVNLRRVNMVNLQFEFGLKATKHMPWYMALDELDTREKDGYRKALDRGEELDRITISTIHGAKGGEADNVALMTDMSRKTWLSYQENEDDEYRVWYTAVTRAKKRLWVLEPMTNRGFEFL